MLPTPTLIGFLATSMSLAPHDRWTVEQLREHQARRLRQLRAYAYTHSPFYRRFHAGRFDRPLDELPVLTNGGEATDLQRLFTGGGSRKRYECLTSGTAGEGVRRCVYDARGWRMVLASFARARAWAGIPVQPWPRVRTAVVASGSRTHQSGAVAASLESWWAPMLSLDAGAPLDRLVTRINAWHPDVIVAYPSIACALADEQQAGRLRVQPRLVASVAEVLTPAARKRLRCAWQCPVVDQYATTEMGCIAAQCSLQSGLHLQEDLAIVEIVDEHNRPVPPGRVGAKILLTVLFNFAMPLIRYQINDRVVIAGEQCACGRPFRLIEPVEGRREELVKLAGMTGVPVTIHPVALYEVLDALPIRSWSLAVSAHEIAVRVDDGVSRVHDGTITGHLSDALRQRGIVPPPIRVDHVDGIARTISRKRFSPACTPDRSDGGGTDSSETFADGRQCST